MQPESVDFVGIGNATVDIICDVPEAFITQLNLPRSSCAFPSAEDVRVIEQALDDAGIHRHFAPGGSAANTACVIAALGGRTRFLGKTADDAYGRIFMRSMEEFGVHHPVAVLPAGGIASMSLYAFITPDHDRTFASYYGASHAFIPEEVEDAHVAGAQFVYIDGYALAGKQGLAIMKRALALARAHGRTAVFNPSAVSVIDTWRDEISAMLPDYGGIICNEQEALALTRAASVEASLGQLAHGRAFAAVTLADAGALAQAGNVVVRLPNPPLPGELVNTNGAGDSFAGGFLYGLAQGWPLQRAVALGLKCSVTIICGVSARPAGSLSHLL